MIWFSQILSTLVLMAGLIEPAKQQNIQNRKILLKVAGNEKSYHQKSSICRVFFDRDDWKSYFRNEYDGMKAQDDCTFYFDSDNYKYQIAFPKTRKKVNVKIMKNEFVSLVNKNHNITYKAWPFVYGSNQYDSFLFKIKIKTPTNSYLQCFHITTPHKTLKICFTVNFYSKVALDKANQISYKSIDLNKNSKVAQLLQIWLFNPFIYQGCNWYLPDYQQQINKKFISRFGSKSNLTKSGRADFTLLQFKRQKSTFQKTYSRFLFKINRNVILKFKLKCEFTQVRNNDLDLKVNLVNKMPVE